MSNRLLRNPLVAVITVVVVILTFLFLLSREARSEEIYLDAGSAMVRGFTPTIGLNIVWHEEGPKKTDYELGFKLIGESEFRGEDQDNQFVIHGMLVDGYKNAELGIGFAYFNVESDYNCQLTFSLLARYRFTERIHTQWHHFSTGGSCYPNYGRDLLTIGWRF
jgi:hypothetical protein